MKSQTAYCSACDKDVRIVITDEPSQDGQANLRDSEVVCLEIGESCTGNLCPIGATPPSVMAARLIRNGLNSILQPLVTARCSGCGHVTSHVLLVGKLATCDECGTTSPQTELVLVTDLE